MNFLVFKGQGAWQILPSVGMPETVGDDSLLK
jgi:hypothetical protein